MSNGRTENPQLREHDHYLMNTAEQTGISTHALCFINYCQIYLNDISLADITDESGMRIETSELKQKRYPREMKTVVLYSKGNQTVQNCQYGLNS
jgi:hypothetical protein